MYTETMGETIVLYHAAGLAHLISMVELGKLILHHYPHFSIIILVTPMPQESSAISSYITRITTSMPLPSLSFQLLPTLNPPSNKALSPIAMVFHFFRLNFPNVQTALAAISLTTSIRALITSAVHDGAYHPQIPTYYYFTSCASALAAFLHLPTLHAQMNSSFKDLAADLFHIPGLPPIKGSDFPQPILDRDDPAYHEFLGYGAGLPKSSGIIVNTFRALEPKAIKAVSDGDCTPGSATPPVYCIGPITADAEDRRGGSRSEKTVDCLAWLEAQPSRSVVFLCFGSRGVFPVEQLMEIAFGLERSEQRFLWVVRSPPPAAAWDEPQLESLMPEGFLERTKERGLVVKSWAPQAAVLSHGSVGGFVTHCGWNSVLEALSAGVPMVAWPLYAEQRMNSVFLVEEMKVAVAMDGSPSPAGTEEERWVSREVVERRVRELMGTAEGERLRRRSAEMKAAASAAWKGDGTSLADFSSLVSSWSSERVPTREQ